MTPVIIATSAAPEVIQNIVINAPPILIKALDKSSLLPENNSSPGVA
jgi:hypothetical protein